VLRSSGHAIRAQVLLHPWMSLHVKPPKFLQRSLNVRPARATSRILRRRFQAQNNHAV